MTYVIAGLIPIVACGLIFALADAWLQESAAEMPSQDRTVEICVDNRFKAAVREGKAELDPVTGHGREYDRIQLECGAAIGQLLPPEPATNGLPQAQER